MLRIQDRDRLLRDTLAPRPSNCVDKREDYVENFFAAAGEHEDAGYSSLAKEGERGATAQVYLVEPCKQKCAKSVSSALIKNINMQP